MYVGSEDQEFGHGRVGPELGRLWAGAGTARVEGASSQPWSGWLICATLWVVGGG